MFCLFLTEFNVKVFTVASEETEGYLRYIRTANYYNVEVCVGHEHKTL